MNIFKKYQTGLVIFGMLLMANACKSPDRNYKDPSFVAVQRTSVSVNESATTPVSVIVQLGIPASERSGSLTVNFTATSTNAVAGIDYQIVSPAGGVLTFGPDEYSKAIVILPVNNTAIVGDRILNVTITGNSAGVVNGFPGPDGNNRTCRVVLVEDDCAYNANGFNGGYRVDDGGDIYNITLNPVTGTPNRFRVVGFYNIASLPTAGLTFDVNPTNNAVTIPDQPWTTGTGGQISAGGRRLRIRGGGGYPNSADGVVSTCDFGFEFNYSIYYEDNNQVFGAYNFKATK